MLHGGLPENYVWYKHQVRLLVWLTHIVPGFGLTFLLLGARVRNACSCSHAASALFPPPRAGTDVMLLENFSTDGSSHHQHHGNSLSVKRRSSVTFEDQVEHSKGARCFLTPLQITGFLEVCTKL